MRNFRVVLNSSSINYNSLILNLISIIIIQLLLPSTFGLPIKSLSQQSAASTEKISFINREASSYFVGYCGNDLKPDVARMSLLNSANKDVRKDEQPSRRKREAVMKAPQYTQFSLNLVSAPRLTEKFNKSNISWGVLDKSDTLNDSVIDGIVADAFSIWAAVTPLTFYKEAGPNPDIIIRFGKGLHGDCPVPFDDLGSQLGHSWTVGEVHINDALSRLHPAILPHVIVHELGHALGLPHDETDPTAIMYSVYYTPERGSPSQPTEHESEIELSQSDVDAIQALYGVCNLKTTSISSLRVNKSYKHSFVVTDGLILSTESISDKTENTVVQEYEIQNRSQRLEVKFKEVEIDYLLQMGKSDGYEAYGISSDLEVFRVHFNKTDDSSSSSSSPLPYTLSDPVLLTDKWPCFPVPGHDEQSMTSLALVTSYYNRRDRTIYFYSDSSTNHMIYRFNTRTNECLEPISFYNLHFDTTFPKFQTLPTTTKNQEKPTTRTPQTDTNTDYGDVIASSNDLIDDATDTATNDANGDVTTQWFTTVVQSAYPLYIQESDIRLVFQEHESQETYILTDQDFWRVRKSDYSLEFGGKIYESWPFLCTF